jgi:hypothetical protein
MVGSGPLLSKQSRGRSPAEHAEHHKSQAAISRIMQDDSKCCRVAKRTRRLSPRCFIASPFGYPRHLKPCREGSVVHRLCCHPRPGHPHWQFAMYTYTRRFCRPSEVRTRRFPSPLRNENPNLKAANPPTQHSFFHPGSRITKRT